MIINSSEFPDPDDFKIIPRTETNTRRALSGKVYGSRLERREELEISFESLKHETAQSLSNLLYEQTAIGLLDLFVKRMSSSDLIDCTNAFKGTVEYIDSEHSKDIDPGFTRNLTFTFTIHAYETF